MDIPINARDTFDMERPPFSIARKLDRRTADDVPIVNATTKIPTDF
jgi:hypothetical protein